MAVTDVRPSATSTDAVSAAVDAAALTDPAPVLAVFAVSTTSRGGMEVLLWRVWRRSDV